MGVSLVVEDDAVMPSTQQPAKPLKVGGSQVAMATKPAAVPPSASHISQLVRTQLTRIIFFGFNTLFFSVVHQSENEKKKVAFS